MSAYIVLCTAIFVANT